MREYLRSRDIVEGIAFLNTRWADPHWGVGNYTTKCRWRSLGVRECPVCGIRTSFILFSYHPDDKSDDDLRYAKLRDHCPACRSAKLPILSEVLKADLELKSFIPMRTLPKQR